MGSAAFAIALGAALAGVAGCTLLVSFDAAPAVEVVDPDSGGPTTLPPSDAETPKDSGGPATSTDARVAGFPPECKSPPPVFGFCSQLGMVCGSRFTDYPGDKVNDLLLCEGESIKAYTCGERCPIGCVKVDGFDDQCDPCQGHADATYCGRDVGWTKRNADIAIVCRSGKTASTATGCK